MKLRIIKFNPQNPNEIFGVDLENHSIIYDVVKQEKKVEFANTESNYF